MFLESYGGADLDWNRNFLIMRWVCPVHTDHMCLRSLCLSAGDYVEP